VLRARHDFADLTPPDRLYPHDATRVGEWQRVQHHGVQRAEHCCSRADAQGERADGDDRERARPCELSCAEQHILPQLDEVLGTRSTAVALSSELFALCGDVAKVA